jgi:hypothetical protein
MSFNPANYSTGPAAAQAPIPATASAHAVAALEQAAARFAARPRQDDFARRSADACLDIAAKLQRFGSFASPAQAAYADKLVAWSQPMAAQIEATVRPPQVAAILQPAPVVQTIALPKLFDLMQRLAKLRFDGLTIARKNGDSLCWIKVEGVEKVVGKIEQGKLTLWQRPMVDLGDLTRRLLEIERDPEAAAVLYGKASGNCSICGRDLTDPESIERGIGPICAGKYFS